jgi:hypothetical protein
METFLSNEAIFVEDRNFYKHLILIFKKQEKIFRTRYSKASPVVRELNTATMGKDRHKSQDCKRRSVV